MSLIGAVPLLALCAGMIGVLPLLALTVVTSGQTLPVDRGEADLGVARAEKKIDGLPIKNDPPELLFAEQSAILVLIDGDPVYRAP